MVGRCKHHGKRICAACFLQTAIFPAEHAIWHYTPGLSVVGRLFGL